MENQSLTLICDGTRQTIANFHGVATYCLVRNSKLGDSVIVSIRGLKDAPLAPGHAIACRTTEVKVTGTAGTMVTLEFVGPPDLALGA